MGEVTGELRGLVLKGQEEKAICRVLRSESFLFQVKKENVMSFWQDQGHVLGEGGFDMDDK